MKAGEINSLKPVLLKKKKKVGLFLRKLSVFLDCKFNSLVCQLGIVFKDSFVIKLE